MLVILFLSGRGSSRTFPPLLEVQSAVKGEEHLIATGLGKQLAQAGLGEPQVKRRVRSSGVCGRVYHLIPRV